MKKRIYLIILLFVFSIIFINSILYANPFENSDIFCFGLSIYSNFYNTSNNSTNLSYGFTFRYKSKYFIGFIFDMLYYKKMYWTVQGSSNYFYNYPFTEEEFKTMFPSIDLNSWNYYHEEFFVHLDFAIWIPIESFIIHFAIGPSFWIAGANSDYYDSNAYFKVAFDDWYNGGLTLGFNTKLGLSLNLNPFLIGFELNYMTSSIKEFLKKYQKVILIQMIMNFMVWIIYQEWDILNFILWFILI